MQRHPALRLLHEQIEARSQKIQQSASGWPCRKGCDHCCRHLAGPPRLTRPEWDFLQHGMRKLAAETQHQIRQRASKRVCPFLDAESGACLVYEYRPVACRTYGFYVARDGGLYCGQIQARVDAGELNHVVWGSAASVEADMRTLGPDDYALAGEL